MMIKKSCERILVLALIRFVCLLAACGPQTAADPTLPVRTAHLAGSSQTTLTDARGFVLYFYVPDTPTQSACTGDCATDWPPLLDPTAGHSARRPSQDNSRYSRRPMGNKWNTIGTCCTPMQETVAPIK